MWASMLLCILASCLLVVSSYDYAHTIYINPAAGEDSPECLNSNSPSSPCANLTWVFQQNRQDSTNYVLSQGTHNLTEDTPQFMDLKHLAFTGNGSLITCTDTGLAFINVEGIVFHDIAFLGCAALRNSTSKNFAKDTIIEFMVGLYFYLCESITMLQVSVSQCPNATGVVIYNTNGTNTFTDSNFTDNRVSRVGIGGGGMYVEFTYCPPGILSCDMPTSERNKNSSFTFTSCKFSNNSADNGEPHLTTVFFIPHNSDHNTFGKGGGLSLFLKGNASGINFMVVNCHFENNVALSGGGLFVNFEDRAHSNNITVSQCQFLNNNCPYSLLDGYPGGGIKIGHLVYNLDGPLPSGAVGNAVNVSHCTFMNNSALHGGGFSCSLVGQIDTEAKLVSIYLSDNTFEQNVAKIGAAIIFDRFSGILKGSIAYVQVEDCYFSNNTIQYAERIVNSSHPYQTGIGAVHVNEVPLLFRGNITFDGNTGSALSAIGTTIDFTNCQAFFTGNQGNKGGAIALLGSAYLQVSNGTSMVFEQNTAMTEGGAIYNTYISREDLKSDTNCFIRHTDLFLHPDDWNAKFNFTLNFDHNGHSPNSIHSTSILPCLVPGDSGLTNSTSEIFCWKNWLYDNSCEHEVTSDIGRMTLHNHHIRVYPGWRFSLPIVLKDDLEHNMTDVSFAVTYNDTHAVVPYRGESVVVNGDPNEIVMISVDSLGNRIWHFDLDVEMKPCPPGFSVNNDSNQTHCSCSGTYGGAILCDDDSKIVRLLNGMWIGKIDDLNNQNGSKYYAMYCPLHYCERKSSRYTIISYSNDPENSVDWDEKVCRPLNRKGVSCGECIEGYGPAVNSQTFECINCTDINLAANIVIYIASVYLPLAVLFTILIVFDIRLTTGPAIAFILYSQMITSTFSLDAGGGIPVINKADKFLRLVYSIPFGIFNLEFIENYIPPLCFSSKFNMLSIFLLDYAVAIFPLLMIILVVICLKISENCCKCMGTQHRRRLLFLSRLPSILSADKKKKVSDALLPAFASFLLLSYTKFSSVSSYILSETRPIDEYGKRAVLARVYFAPQFSMHDPDYLLYFIPAIIVGTIVTLTPLVLLDYPLKALEWCIVRVRCLKMIYPNDKIHLFLNMFQGCYRPRMRFFAGLYFLFRWVINVSYISRTWLQQFLVQQSVTAIIIALLAVFHPYDWYVLNYVDIFIFTNIIVLNSINFYLYSYTRIDPNLSIEGSAIAIRYVLVFLPLIYMIAFLVWHVTRSYHHKIKKAWKKRFSKTGDYEPLSNVVRDESSSISGSDTVDGAPKRDKREFKDDFEAMMSRAEDPNTYSPIKAKSMTFVEVSGQHLLGGASTLRSTSGSEDSALGQDISGGQVYGTLTNDSEQSIN